MSRPDPPPEDGELAYTGPLEGRPPIDQELLDAKPREPDVVPGQLTIDEALSQTDEMMGLREPYPAEPR